MFKISYIIGLVVLLILVSLSYILILNQHRKNRALQANGDDTYYAIDIKISIIIGSQLVTWLSYMATAIYFSWVSDSGVPDSVTEVFATVVVPINSLLNPIFYSEDYKRIEAKLRKLKLQFSRRDTNTVDNIEMAEFSE